MMRRNHIEKQENKGMRIENNLSPRVIFLFVNNEPFVVEGTIGRMGRYCRSPKQEIDHILRFPQNGQAPGQETA